MNGEHKENTIRTLREIPKIWNELINLSEQIEYGEIVIKIHQRKISIAEYTIKRRPSDEGNILKTIPLL